MVRNLLWPLGTAIMLGVAACQPVAPMPVDVSADTGGANTATRALSSTLRVVESPPFTLEESVSLDTLAPNPLVMQAMKDLARRLSVSLQAIALVEFESVIWPDASLGCPRPGMAYRQVQQDGARIVLEVNGRSYVYHSGGSRAPFMCESPAQGSAPGVVPGIND